MTESIYIDLNLQSELIDHARSELPNECCGYITGVNLECRTLHRMTNVDASPVHFSFDPKEQFQVVKSARQVGEQPLVVYHSHPESEAVLSNEDLRLLKDPNMIYLIISLDNDLPDLRAYRVINEEIKNVSIMATKGGNVS